MKTHFVKVLLNFPVVISIKKKQKRPRPGGHFVRLKAQDGVVPQPLLLRPRVSLYSLLLLPAFVSAGLVHRSSPCCRLGVLRPLPALTFPRLRLPPPLLRIARFLPAPPAARLLLGLLAPCRLRPLPSPLLISVLAVARAAAAAVGRRVRGRGGLSALPSRQTLGRPERVRTGRGAPPSWTVTANQAAARRTIVQSGFHVIGPADRLLSSTSLLLRPVFGRKSRKPRLEPASFLNLDVIGQLVRKRAVDLLLAFAEVEDFLLPG